MTTFFHFGTAGRGRRKHVHPLQLDVIDRLVELLPNPGEVVLTPFMGVGSEVFSPVSLGRKAIGIELKDVVFQASKNQFAIRCQSRVRRSQQRTTNTSRKELETEARITKPGHPEVAVLIMPKVSMDAGNAGLRCHSLPQQQHQAIAAHLGKSPCKYAKKPTS